MTTKRMSMLCLLLMMITQLKSQENKIDFNRDLTFPEVLAKAKKENKLVFVDCYATWCIPCKKMDKEVFSSPEIDEKLSKSYIFYKIQGDSVQNDPPEVKRKYREAKELLKKYSVFAYPTLLFVSPAGLSLVKESGYRDISAFLKLADSAAKEQSSYQHYKMQYWNTKMTRLSLLDLMEVAKQKQDIAFADSVAMNYRKNHFHKAYDNTTIDKPNTKFVINFPKLLSTKDKYFIEMLANPAAVDSLVGKKSISKGLIDATISREEVIPIIFSSENKPISQVDWPKLEKNLTSKYGKLTSDRVIATNKEKYYKSIGNMEESVKYGMKRIELNGIDSLSVGAAGINNFIYNKLLKYNRDKELFKQAEAWMVILLRNDPKDPSFLDTKANLHYFLGEYDKAIELEKKAIEIEKGRKGKFQEESLKELTSALEKFENARKGN